MHYMTKTHNATPNDPPKTPRKRGEQMTIAARNVLIAKVLDYMSEGVMSTRELAKRTGVSRPTIDRIRPLVDEIIGRDKIDRNIIRNLQIRRTYELIEMLMNDLKLCQSIKERSIIYGNIFKFSSHLALITGLNIETQVNLDAKQLVVIRPAKRDAREAETAPTDGAIDVTRAAELPEIAL